MVFQERRERDREQPITENVEDLAHRMLQEWELAEDMHRLNDLYALSVSWRGERGHLTDPLTKVYETYESWAAQESAVALALPSNRADPLSGEGTDLARILRDHIPTGRLVVLGNKGSGKTVLLERLLHQLLEWRNPGDPVHVRIPLGIRA